MDALVVVDALLSTLCQIPSFVLAMVVPPVYCQPVMVASVVVAHRAVMVNAEPLTASLSVMLGALAGTRVSVTGSDSAPVPPEETARIFTMMLAPFTPVMLWVVVSWPLPDMSSPGFDVQRAVRGVHQLPMRDTGVVQVVPCEVDGDALGVARYPA